MKKYFAEMQYQNQPKNKAEAAVQNFARELNATLIYGEENLQVFVEQFKIRVHEINLHFPRCKDIGTSFRIYENHKTIWVSADDVTRIDFREVKREFPEQIYRLPDTIQEALNSGDGVYRP